VNFCSAIVRILPHWKERDDVLELLFNGLFDLMLFFIFDYLLFVICYLLFVICYLLFVICYLLFVICYLLFVICDD